MTTEQLTLINSLMYYDGLMLEEGETLGDCITDMKENDPEAYQEMIKKNPGFVGEENAEKIIEAILKDEELSSLEIYKSSREYPYDKGPVMACFVDPDSKEALVAYRGTNGQEWMDNAEGFLQESSTLQLEALEFFDECADELSEEGYEIDVTGHSKGGNKAQYVTIKDERVRNCYSFNGQGFSDEFCEENADLIKERSDKITAYAASDDYVHCLGNQIAGTNIWFETNEIDAKDLIKSDNKLVNGLLDIDIVSDAVSGVGSIAMAHTPNAYFQFDENDNVVMNEETSQSAHAQELNELSVAMMKKPQDVKEEYFTSVMGVIQNQMSDDPLGEYDTPSFWETMEGLSKTAGFAIDYYLFQDETTEIHYNPPTHTLEGVFDETMRKDDMNPRERMWSQRPSKSNLPKDILESEIDETMQEGDMNPRERRWNQRPGRKYPPMHTLEGEFDETMLGREKERRMFLGSDENTVQHKGGVYLNRISSEEIKYQETAGNLENQIAVCGFPDKESAIGTSYIGVQANCVFPARDKNGNQLVIPQKDPETGEVKNISLNNVRIGDAGSIKPIIRPTLGEDGKLTNQRIDMPVEKIRESCDVARNISKENSMQNEHTKIIQTVLQESESIVSQPSVPDMQYGIS